jgi:hypothetical protein
MRPYSTDFRLKIVRAYERGEGSQRQLARVFGVSRAFSRAYCSATVPEGWSPSPMAGEIRVRSVSTHQPYSISEVIHTVVNVQQPGGQISASSQGTTLTVASSPPAPQVAPSSSDHVIESDKDSLTSELPEEKPPREGGQLFFRRVKTVKDRSEPTKASVVYADTTDT